MNNKKVVETFMEGYNTGDNAKILSCLAEDVIWEMAGAFSLKTNLIKKLITTGKAILQ